MNFLKNNKRFSFKYADTNAWELSYKTEVRQENNTLITTYYFENGIKVTNIAKKYEEFDAYEWVNYFENTSDLPSEIISELNDCDCVFGIEHEGENKWKSYFPDKNTATKIYAPRGSTWRSDEMFCDVDKIVASRRIHHIYSGDVKKYSASGGRSNEESAPFFNIHKNGAGYIFAIGWTGQWNAQVERAEDTVTIKTKIEDTAFRMMPKEKFRTSSIVIMPYEGDVVKSHNKWRRLVKKYFSLIGSPGRDEYGPLSAMVWGGMSSDAVIERINKIEKNNIPYEYIWMDAGWYGIDTEPTPDEFEGDWFEHTGDWRVSRLIHPDKLRDVSKAVHDSGRKFLLWFEPERVRRITPIAKEHPEYFLELSDDNDNLLLNLGDENAWNYCYETVAGVIEDLKIDCYRQDFNFAPLEYWRKNDAEDRKGISEIKHINGMYRFWDALLEKFPNMIIDNCAGGGRRIDIETLRRSMPLWRSDYGCPANYDVEAAQCHNMSFGTWMPYSSTGSGRVYDEYRVRSTYSSGMSMAQAFSAREEYCDTQEKIDFLKKYTEEYLRLRPYFSEDFYPLTEFSDRLDVWCAMQYDRPEKNDGIVLVFKRENSPYETATFNLRGICEGKNYLFEDIDGGEFEVSGKELSKSGLKINIRGKRCAKIFIYKSI